MTDRLLSRRSKFLLPGGLPHALIDRLHEKLGRLDGANVRQYAADAADPWRIVLDVLMKREQEELGAAESAVVLAGAELTPQMVTQLPRERILAVVKYNLPSAFSLTRSSPPPFRDLATDEMSELERAVLGR